MKRYKLVTQDYKTRAGKPNETTWEIGKRVEAAGEPGGGLCTDSFVHCYDSPELAVFLNPMHAGIDNPRMLVVEAHGRGKNDSGLKRGYRAMTPLGEIDCPQPTITQRIAFGILCVKQVYTERKWNAWADAWLSGEDRSRDSARAVTRDARATYVAVLDATHTRIGAAYTAAHAAYDAAYGAARDTYAAYAAHDAAYVADAYAAHDAAYVADAYAAYAYAAASVVDAANGGKLDFVAIAKQAMAY